MTGAGGEFDVHPATLRAAGGSLNDAATRLQSEWQAMAGYSQGMADAFGDDMVSSLIGTTYQIAEQMAADSYTSAAEGLQEMADGLMSMADNYEATEQANTSTMDRIGQEL
jgi:hypothetical protein